MSDDDPLSSSGEPVRSHEHWDELAVGWALHSLDGDDEITFLRHLPDCARCLRTVRQTEQTMATLAATLPQQEPPAGLRRRLVETAAQPHDSTAPTTDVLRRVTEDPAGPAVAHQDWRRSPRRRPGQVHSRSRWATVTRLVAAAAAIVVIAAMLVWNLQLQDARDSARAQVERQEQVIDGLVVPGHTTLAALRADDSSPVIATVVIHADQAKVVSTALEPNSRDQTYVLWGQTTPDQPMIGLGTFDISHTGTSLTPVNNTGPIDSYQTYAISIEPGHTVPPQPTNPVAQGTIDD